MTTLRAGVVLVDAGLFVAALGKRDKHHEWAKQMLRRLPASASLGSSYAGAGVY